MRNPTSAADTAPDAGGSGRSGPVREVALIALAAVAVYVLLALVSWSPADPGVTHAGTHLTVANLVGVSGAYAADAALFGVGWLAYLIPAAPAAAAAALVRRRWSPSWSEICLRAAGFVAFLVAACPLVALHALDARLPAGAGGALGQQLAAAGLPVLNEPGVTLVAAAAAAVGLQTAVGFTWLGLVEAVGRLLFRVAELTVAGILAVARFPRRLARRDARAAATVLAPPPAARVERPAPARRRRRRQRTPPAVAPPAPAADDEFRGAPEFASPLPELGLLDPASEQRRGFSEESLARMSRLLEERLEDFGVEAQVMSVLPGPVVTRFELQPAAGVKVSKIAGLAKDLARSLAVISVRIVEVIPGKSVIGIEIPNQEREVVRLREILDSDAFRAAAEPLTLALGKDISGQPVLAEIGRMPHLLVAGTTGSGKSVGINGMLVSMLYKASPERLRLILVDPKMLELAVYDGIPHLLTPVVTDMKDAAAALNWCVAEMERRYRLMAGLGVRHLAGYNRRLDEAAATGAELADPTWPAEAADPAPPLRPLPYIVVVIDEFADMMMIVGKKVDQLIARIAQKARAAGIHLILATQRPSVDVITGLIKANIPARIGFQVSSRVDSRTILDQGGAEQLLGNGDMLFLPPGTATPTRVHGAFVSDEEVHRVVDDWKARGAPDYSQDVLAATSEVVPLGAAEALRDAGVEASDALYDQAVAFVLESRRASISSVQRKFRIGYNRSARLIEAMEEAGVVSPMNASGGREVLAGHRE